MKAKRFLAFLLAVILIGGMLPAQILAADTVKNPEYVFSNSAFNATGRQYHIHTETNALDRTKSTGYYEYVYHVGLNAFPLTDVLNAWNEDEAEFGNSALILKATIDEPGAYDAEVNYVRYNYSGKMGVYFIPVSYADTKWNMKAVSDISPIITDENAICLVSGLDTNLQAGSDTQYTAEKLVFDENDYYVLITVDKSDYPTNDGTRYYSCVKSIALTQTRIPTGDEQYVTYNFTSSGRPDYHLWGTLEDKYGVWTAGYADYPANPTNPGQMWAYNGSGIGVAVTTSGFNFLHASYLMTNKYAADDWVAFRVKVPANGRYILESGTAYKYKNSTSNLKMYLVPMDDTLRETFKQGNTATFGTTSDKMGTGYYYRDNYKPFSQLGISESYLIGSTNLYMTGDNFDNPLDLSDTQEMELKAKSEYLLVLRSAAAGVPSLTTLTFEYTETIPVLDKIEASFGGDGNVLIGSKLSPSVVWFSEDEEIDGKDGAVSFEVLEDADNILLTAEDGSIYATATGSVKLRVTGTLREITKTADVTANIVVDNSYSGSNQSYNFCLGAYPDSTTAVSFRTPGEMNEANFIAGCIYQDYGTERPWGFVATKAS